MSTAIKDETSTNAKHTASTVEEHTTTDTATELKAAQDHVAALEAELAKAKRAAQPAESEQADRNDDSAAATHPARSEHSMARNDEAHAMHAPALHGADALREEPMMRHLMEALDRGDDIGHYGRLTFCMVGRHFLDDEELLTMVTHDGDFSEGEAAAMLAQVKDRGYSPPRRARILEWQAEQSFAIIPDAKDPDCGNVYRTLHFPQRVYSGIEHYREDKMASE